MSSYRIIEEVPGVPASERWFVAGPTIRATLEGSVPYPTFATLDAAREWLRAKGITEFVVQRYSDEFL